MIWDGSWLVHRLVLSKSIEFEWGVFYLPPITPETSRYAPDEPMDMCVIGGSASQFSVTKRAWSDTGNPETSKRLQRAIQFLQFLCLPENADRIINESLRPASVLTDLVPPICHVKLFSRNSWPRSSGIAMA